MCDISGWEWLAAVAGAIVIGISKTGMPGAGILAIPLFAAIMPAKASTGVVLPLLIAADVFAVSRYHRTAEWKHLFRLFPWTMTGVVAGFLLMNRLSDAALRPVIGLVVLVMLAVHLWRRSRPDLREKIPTSALFAAPIGLLAGAATMLANAAGSVMMVYMLAMRLPKTAFVSTVAVYFLLMNLFKVPFSAKLGLINPESLLLNLALLPAVAAGALAGFVLLRKMPEKPFEAAVMVLTALGALRLMF